LLPFGDEPVDGEPVPGSRSSVYHDLPDTSQTPKTELESSRDDEGVDRLGRMNECPEGVSPNPEHQVNHPHSQSRPPCISRIDQPIDVPGVSNGCTDQRRHIRITANDTVERDDIGRPDVAGEFNEVALME
jgi:hypothetical protein